MKVLNRRCMAAARHFVYVVNELQNNNIVVHSNGELMQKRESQSEIRLIHGSRSR